MFNYGDCVIIADEGFFEGERGIVRDVMENEEYAVELRKSGSVYHFWGTELRLDADAQVSDYYRYRKTTSG